MKQDRREEDRELVTAALKKYGYGGRVACCAAAGINNPPNLSHWLAKGAGVAQSKVDLAVAWAREVLRSADQLDQLKAIAQDAQLSTALGAPPLPDKEAAPHMPVATCGDCGESLLGCECGEEPTFDPEPYPESQEKSPAIHVLLKPTPPQWVPASPSPSPAAFVLEAWAAEKLAYAMETHGCRLPEGYRWRVSVERCS